MSDGLHSRIGGQNENSASIKQLNGIQFRLLYELKEMRSGIDFFFHYKHYLVIF